MGSLDSRTTKQIVFALIAVAVFQIATQLRLPPIKRVVSERSGLVVIPAPVQVFMYAGDKYLAADIEYMRAVSMGTDENPALADYRIRAHELVSQLNPCHQDNYMVANAILSWGGSPEVGNRVLARASKCRYWDDIAPFLLGFNRYFFEHDIDGAIQAIDMAAKRSEQNRSALQQMSIIIASKKFNDVKMAAAYLAQQIDETSDPRIKKSLGRRQQRLSGLILLREAQTRYEEREGHPLRNPNDLISSGILKAFPQDPLRIGYEFVDGRFQLRAIKIAGKEIR